MAMSISSAYLIPAPTPPPPQLPMQNLNVIDIWMDIWMERQYESSIHPYKQSLQGCVEKGGGMAEGGGGGEGYND